MKPKKSYGFENDLNLKTLVALSRCFQSVRRRELKTIKRVGLTVAQFGVLEILYHKGDLRICEILEGTLSTGGNMTVVIENLERSGFVVRYPDPLDGRASLIQITGKGKELIDGMFFNHVANIGDIFSVLSTGEKQQLVQLLKKLGSATA